LIVKVPAQLAILGGEFGERLRYSLCFYLYLILLPHILT
jgi:hypothetical protein